MIEIDDNLFFGVGNEPAGSDGAVIARVSPAGVVTAEHSLDEQGVHDMHVNAGKVYVAGTDPTDDWTLGNLYIRGTDEAWLKRRTLPLTIHTWGLCHDGDGHLWAGVGAHTGDNATWEGRVLRSTDDGLTWDVNIKLNDYRVYDIIWANGYYYATGYNWSSGTGYQWQLWWSTDGLSWTQFSGVQPHRHQRLVVHGTDVVTVNVQRTHLIVVDGETVTSFALPATFREIVFNALTSVDGVLFFADATGRIWRTADYQNWTQYSYIANAISLSYWPSQSCLVASDVGAQAKLWKIAL